MRAIWAMAIKDLRLLARDRAAVFLTFFWPLVLATFFGALGPFGGASEAGTMRVAVVDHDRSHASASLRVRVEGDPRIELIELDPDVALERVRKGELPALLEIPRGYGGKLPLVDTPELELVVDPRRKIEGEVLVGVIERASWEALGEWMLAPSPQARSALEMAAVHTQDPERKATLEKLLALAQTRADADQPGALRPVALIRRDVEAAPRSGLLALDAARPPSPYAVTFPQGIVWAVLACAATFAVSLVNERTRGTLLRLAVAPLSRLQILLGKALACLLAIMVMQAVLVAVAVLGFEVAPQSWPLLLLALGSTAVGFVGIMTLLAALGRRTHSTAGLSWAVLMVLAVLGGGMLPLFLMPEWLQTIASTSPVAWSLAAIEGAMWRGAGLSELGLPCGALLSLGGVCLMIGSRAVDEL